MLNSCAELIDGPSNSEGGTEQQRQRLATELALHPETYSIVAGLIMGQFDDLEDQRGFGSSLGAYGDVLGEGGGEGEDYESALDGEWTRLNLDEFEEVAGEFPRSSSAHLHLRREGTGDYPATGSNPERPQYGGASPSLGYSQSPPQSPEQGQSNRLLLDQDLSDYFYHSQQMRQGNRSGQGDDDDDYDM